jgi:hypothetical protein
MPVRLAVRTVQLYEYRVRMSSGSCVVAFPQTAHIRPCVDTGEFWVNWTCLGRLRKLDQLFLAS